MSGNHGDDSIPEDSKSVSPPGHPISASTKRGFSARVLGEPGRPACCVAGAGREGPPCRFVASFAPVAPVSGVAHKSAACCVVRGPFTLLLPLFGASGAVSGVGQPEEPLPKMRRADLRR